MSGCAMGTAAEAEEQRDWLALPTGALQHVACLASTWQIPGDCLVAPVCRSWRSAAAGCSSIRLRSILYHARRTPADMSFAVWLECNGWRLEALILSGQSTDRTDGLILPALAEAAAAAQAAGSPLRLHTLRVLHEYVDIRTAGHLLARLPYLRCLQLRLPWCEDHAWQIMTRAAVQEALAPLQRATQLEELHLKGVCPVSKDIARLLPPSLKRLSWDKDGMGPPSIMRVDLSHLTQLTFLRLRWLSNRISSSQLPPGLQQLELVSDTLRLMSLEIDEAQQQLLKAWGTIDLRQGHVQQLLTRLQELTAVSVNVGDLDDPAAGAALQQLQQLSALTVIRWYGRQTTAASLPAAVATAASMRGLRRLCLHLRYLCAPPALDTLTQLTQLRVSGGYMDTHVEQRGAWVAVLGRMTGLQWLSVPDGLLTPGQAWLAGLQQLRVLVLRWEGASEGCMPWLEGFSPEGLLPRLQVLGVHNKDGQAVPGGVRRRLQRLLGSSGCEVVVVEGVDLDEVADPTQQLAGLPEALQQVLA